MRTNRTFCTRQDCTGRRVILAKHDCTLMSKYVVGRASLRARSMLLTTTTSDFVESTCISEPGRAPFSWNLLARGAA